MENKATRQIQYDSLKKDSTTIWLLFLFLGWSYGSLGSIGKQILYYVTLAGCGLWGLYLLFNLNKKIKEYNKNVALSLGMTVEELALNKVL